MTQTQEATGIVNYGLHQFEAQFQGRKIGVFYSQALAERAIWLEEAFTNPVTREPYAIPANLREAATRIVQAYGINGVCDPMYIANVIAKELGLGDGLSNFAAQP